MVLRHSVYEVPLHQEHLTTGAGGVRATQAGYQNTLAKRRSALNQANQLPKHRSIINLGKLPQCSVQLPAVSSPRSKKHALQNTTKNDRLMYIFTCKSY